MDFKLPTGFPSPADDFMEIKLSLDNHLIENPAATFILRVQNDAMFEIGIFPNDLLIVDRSIPFMNGQIVVAVYDEELVVRKLEAIGGSMILKAANPNLRAIHMGHSDDCVLWGVVTYAIHGLRSTNS